MKSQTADRRGARPRRKLAELSETELVAWIFSVNDPETLEGVSDEPPPPEEPEVEFFYDMAGCGMKVRCVYCGFPNHYAGIVVRYPSGARRLVGRDCARTHHGVDFERQLVEFDAAVERQSYARRKRALIAAGSEIASAFAELRAHPAVGNHDAVLGRLRGALPELAAALANVARRSERLLIDHVVRDVEGERARKEQLGEQFETARQEAKEAGRPWQLFRHEEEDAGPLEGALFFSSGVKVARRLTEIEAAVQGDALSHEYDRLDAAQAAFAADNLVRVARWANEAAAEAERREAVQENRRPAFSPRFRASGHSLVERPAGRDIEVALPDTYHCPRRSLIALLRKAATLEHEP